MRAAVDAVEGLADPLAARGAGGLSGASVMAAEVSLLHRRVAAAEASVEAALSSLGLRFSTSGALGRRTRYQEKSIAQLTLQASVVRAASAADATAVEQLEPYVRAVTEAPKVWAAATRALRLKVWSLGSELARSLAALGMFTQAAGMFSEMRLWDEYIQTLAERVVRERLDAAPTPEMWCYLGDFTEETRHYSTAWELSAGSRQAWEEARSELRCALGVKARGLAEARCLPFRCGRLHAAVLSAGAPRRGVVLLRRAWATLGGLFGQLRQPREALCAFREACRLRGEKHELWKSSAALAADLSMYSEAIFRGRRALETGGAPDPVLAAVLADAVVKDTRAADMTGARRLLPQLRTLLGLYTAAQPGAAQHWQTALYVERKRASTEWTKDAAALDAVSEAAAQLVEARLDSGCEPGELKRLGATVDELVHAAAERLAATAGSEGLRMVQARLRRHLEDLD
ncbi:hypothetical protein EMIHUDRAFT_234946 [Emiliania huxleyi CCMP1516]|uniref:Uncharacterized protein n=2 Tax=Emiliania huxleyi TaxID=2903 RepID=A0A0D3JXG1_EMIH1|nr:hypothetical protein EMIHUDRAFT_234946 [Emiliania huxleyi CCMP1516]EOD28196.1 hypothetical protein EMIHUDRAFT_234946 [Emiliania huxleyi CCMP1516]|eukprot:XP_005780625.1 hypothetical protein EMIHUDRAFT_234946 [Emiliania huxleyi CCMP1516]